MASQFDLTEDQIAIQNMVCTSNWDDAHCHLVEVGKSAGKLAFGSICVSEILGDLGPGPECTRHTYKGVRLPC